MQNTGHAQYQQPEVSTVCASSCLNLKLRQVPHWTHGGCMRCDGPACACSDNSGYSRVVATGIAECRYAIAVLQQMFMPHLLLQILKCGLQ